jgi:RNA polymerase sigma factor (sigma-70 family)
MYSVNGDHDHVPEAIVRSSDEQLLVSSQADAQLFAGFYDRHAKQLLAFFARRTFEAQVAADLTAETMAEAFASRGRYRDRGTGSAAAWLYTIGRRQLSRFWRRQRVEEVARRRLGIAALTLSAEDIERVEELIDFAEVGAAVAAALTRLRSEQREALTLRVIDGRSYQEIARTLGCSQGVVRARVSRGLKQLAAHLEA